MVIGVFIHVLLGSVFSYHCPTVFFKKNTNFVNIMFNGLFVFLLEARSCFLGCGIRHCNPGCSEHPLHPPALSIHSDV